MSGLRRVRKRPVEVEAIQFAGDVGAPGIVDLDLECGHDPATACDVLFIPTLEGTFVARPGDWIIRGVKGELYPCKPDIFVETYEILDDEPGPPEGQTTVFDHLEERYPT